MLGACEKVDEIVNGNSGPETYYHLSLGTSLSVGVQPNGSGVTLPTSDGYADQLYSSIKPGFDTGGTETRDLQLNRLGCPGETLDSMVNGGSCLYLAGSQLEAAIDFLTDNAGRVHLVTIDMGGNDFRNAGCVGAVVDLVCATDVSGVIFTELGNVLAALRAAAGPDTIIVGMNYYNPYLATHFDGVDGPALAILNSEAADIFMESLRLAFENAAIPMADVAAAFQSGDFVTMVPNPLPGAVGDVPLSVANVCTFTYMCNPPPEGPDIHANPAGYSLIATAFEDVLNALSAAP
jgi:lysophospholipase L1-like esterase